HPRPARGEAGVAPPRGAVRRAPGRPLRTHGVGAAPAARGGVMWRGAGWWWPAPDSNREGGVTRAIMSRVRVPISPAGRSPGGVAVYGRAATRQAPRALRLRLRARLCM